jgi:uncharacterized protein
MRPVRWMCGSIGVLLLAGGCASSPPLRYYTLSEVPSAADDNTRAGSAASADSAAAKSSGTEPASSAGNTGVFLPLKIGHVAIPSEIDRAQLVSRLDATRLQIAEMDRWAAPLDEMIRRVLAANLTSRLPAGSVLDFSSPDSKGVLSVDIQELYGDANCEVTLRATWELVGAKDQSRRGTEMIHTPSAGACPGALAEGISRAIGDLSDRLTTAASQPPAG